MKNLVRTLARLTLAVYLIPAAFSQSATSIVNGRITDPSGAAIPGASVRIVNVETDVRRDTVTNGQGNYDIPVLPPGNYRIEVQKQGFRPLTRTGTDLQVGQVARIDFTLELGDVAESLTVRASAPLLDQETSSLGQVIDSSKVLNIPLNGRSPFRLVQLTPGVLSVPSTNGQFGDLPVNTMDDSIISINGGRAKTNEVLIDGIPSTTGYVNQMTTIPNVDATQEFKVQSNNLSAEYGRFTGGVINVLTRSGTNQLHGSLYEFLRNSATDSNEFFNKRAGKEIPPFRMNQFGFATGGPVILPGLYSGKDKTFFFTDYQGARWRQGSIFIGTVPTARQRAGDFSQSLNSRGQLEVIYDPTTTQVDPSQPGHSVRTAFPANLIPASRLDPVGSKLAAFYPLPNLPGDPLTQANNYISNAPRGIDQANYSVRLDHNVNENNRLFGRFSSNRTTLAQPDIFGNPATTGVGANGKLQLFNYTAGADNSLVLNPKTVLDLRYGFARFYWQRPTRSLGFDQTQLGLPTSLVSQFGAALFPIVNVEDFSGMGGGSLLRTGQDTHSLLASLSHLMGSQSLKFGIDIRVRRLNTFNLASGGGTYAFNRVMTQGPEPNVVSAAAGLGFASLLLGTPTSGTVNIAAGNSLQDFYYAGYLQDDIRLTRRLTLNLGFRYEVETPYTERRNQLNRFSFGAPSPAANPLFPNITGALSFANDKNRTVYDPDLNNFAPRAGFAYNFLPKTVFRGGAGMFYAPFSITSSDTGFAPTAGYSSTSQMLATLDGVTPYRFVNNPYPTGLAPPTRDSLGAQTSLGLPLSVWEPKGTTPYSLQWNADLQRELPGSFIIDIAYAGSHGVKLNQPREYNALNPQYLSLASGLQTLVANPFASLIPSGTLSQPRIAQRQLLLPYPQYTSVSLVNASWGNSIYHSMALKVERRFSHGVGFLLSYTQGKLISDVPDSLSTYDNSTNAGLNTSVQNWYNLRAERSLSELDVARTLSLSYVIELPFGPGKYFLANVHGLRAKFVEGWRLNGVTSYRSGLPLVLSATVTGGGTRPNSTGKSANLGAGRSRQDEIFKWFDTSAFTVPAAFTFGNVSRTLPDVRGPALTNFDVSLVKNTRILERVGVEFRVESFNVMNTPHLWAPNTNANSNQFGQIASTTGNPRVMQFAIKLLF